MALDIENPEHERRPVGFSIAGIFLMMIAGFIVYDIVQRRADASPTSSTYEYTVTQGIDTSLEYFDSSFFDNGPDRNSAYVSDLTNMINAAFRYTYKGSQSADLTYVYDVKAIVRGNYPLQDNTKDMSSVWTKEVQLVEPTEETVTGRTIVLNHQVDVPYAEYKKLIEQFKTALTLPLSSEVTVKMSVRVMGTIGGTALDDRRELSVSAPLDQAIYVISKKFDKHDTKRIIPQETINNRSAFEKYAIIIAAVVGLLGLISLGYGLRKQIFKTPYQRELDKIYRYHDGIIIKASEETDIEGKQIVPVLSFDDMLNLEEELKSPIVASPAGGEATHFMILHGDVVYRYTLGKVLLTDEKLIEAIDRTDIGDLKPKPRKKQGK